MIPNETDIQRVMRETNVGRTQAIRHLQSREKAKAALARQRAEAIRRSGSVEADRINQASRRRLEEFNARAAQADAEGRDIWGPNWTGLPHGLGPSHDRIINAR